MRPSRLLLVAAILAACNTKDDGSDAGVPTDTDTVPAGAGSVPAELAQHGVVTCADPGFRSASGPFDRRTSQSPPNSDLWIWAGGEIAGDLDGDGLLDVLTPNELGLELYDNTGGGDFVQRGQQVMGGFDLGFGTGGSVVDYDGDGDLDVYVTRFQGEPGPEGIAPSGEPYGKNRLLQNQGDGTFVDVTDEAGVSGCGLDANTGEEGCFRSMSSSWGDIDRDGDLDLFVGNYGWVDESGVTQDFFEPAEPSFLYENNGDGTFTDISDVLPQELKDGYTYAGGFVDLDGDGWLDLYTVNDFGNKWPNRVMWNEEGTLVFGAGSASRGLEVSTTGMGVSYGDLNGDGMVEVVVPAWNKNHLWVSNADLGDGGLWIDSASEADVAKPDGSRGQKVGWGGEFGDMDNDGDLDIVMQYGFVANDNEELWSNPYKQPDALYLNEPGGSAGFTFTDVGKEWGVNDPGVSRGVVLADLNRDGWLDIGRRDLDGPNIAYLSHCGEEGWLVVHLSWPSTMNTRAIGARVRVEVGGQVYTRQLLSGGTGYGTGGPPEVHVGLGMVDQVDSVEVIWPDGENSVFYDVPTRQQLTVTR